MGILTKKLKDELGKATLPQKIFLFSALALFAYTFIALIFTKGQSIFILLHSDFDDSFMDFFNSIYDAEAADPYKERMVIYPAFCYLFYKAFGLFMPQDVYDAQVWRIRQSGIVSFLGLTVITCVLLYLLMKPRKRFSSFDSILPVFLILGSVPFLYAYERGNIILQALLFIFVFVRFYRSENKFLKELALISLAIAACIKIYPALFGLLLLKEKRWKEAVRCIIYAILIFILPFFYFNGFESIKIMIENIKYNGMYIMNSRGYGYKANLGNTISFIEEMFKIPVPNSVAFLTIALCILTVIILSKEAWKIQAAICSAMILLVDFSYTYTLIYMAVPLILFIESRSNVKYIDWAYAVLFVCMFAPFSFGGYNPFGLDPNVLYPLGLTTFIQSIALVMFVILLTVDTVITFTKSRNKKLRMV